MQKNNPAESNNGNGKGLFSSLVDIFRPAKPEYDHYVLIDEDFEVLRRIPKNRLSEIPDYHQDAAGNWID